MSMYNMIFGMNPAAGPLLKILGFSKETFSTIPRFRDCYINLDKTRIVIYTRTGGGNRAEYAEQNSALTKLPGYTGDEDDSFDSTYAKFYFKVPDEHKDFISELAALGASFDPTERMKNFLEELKKRPLKGEEVK